MSTSVLIRCNTKLPFNFPKNIPQFSSFHYHYYCYHYCYRHHHHHHRRRRLHYHYHHLPRQYTHFTQCIPSSTINHHSPFPIAFPSSPLQQTLCAVESTSLSGEIPRPHLSNTVVSACIIHFVVGKSCSPSSSYITSPTLCINYGFESTLPIHRPWSTFWPPLPP